jgi:hypothetical protein
MPLLNYTTTIAPSKTVAEVHKILVKAGARQIASEYDEHGEPIAVAFTVETTLGLRQFHLPINSSAVLAVLSKQRVANKYRTQEQAARVAWRIVKDWLEAQLAIIETEMVTLDQIMLPYMRTATGPTMWELYTEQQLELGAGEQS